MLLEWDFSSTNETMKVETTKGPYGPGSFITNSPESWHSWIKRILLLVSISLLCCMPDARGHIHFPTDRHQRMFSLVTNPNSYDLAQDKMKISSRLWFFLSQMTTKDSHQKQTSKTNGHVWEKRGSIENKITHNKNLYQSHCTQGTSSYNIFSY